MSESIARARTTIQNIVSSSEEGEITETLWAAARYEPCDDPWNCESFHCDCNAMTNLFKEAANGEDASLFRTLDRLAGQEFVNSILPFLASAGNQALFVELVQRQDIFPDNFVFASMCETCLANMVETARYLLETFPEQIREQSNRLLRNAYSHGSLQIAELLLETQNYCLADLHCVFRFVIIDSPEEIIAHLFGRMVALGSPRREMDFAQMECLDYFARERRQPSNACLNLFFGGSRYAFAAFHRNEINRLN